MSTCPRCAARFPEGAAFCPVCGETFVATGAPPATGAASHQRPVSSPAQQALGFLPSIFDFSFRSFITGKLIKLLYLCAMAVAAVFALSVIVAGFHQNAGVGLLALLLSPVAFLLVMAYSRVVLEIMIVVFRIEEHLAALRQAPV